MPPMYPSSRTELLSNNESEQPRGAPVVGSRYQRELRATCAIDDNSSEQVKEMAAALEAKDERLRTIVSEVTALQREVDRAKKSAKFDLVAREGQTKKLGILEHSVVTLRHDLKTSNDRRQKLEGKTAVLERSWQNERSLRLRDLHRHDAMSSDTKHAEKVAVDAEEKWLAAEKRVQILETAVETKARELEAQCKINEAQAGEISAQAAEIEMHRTEVFGLKRTLLTREGEISQERTSTSNLRRELSRVRRDFIVSTINRSEQHNALIGGRRKNPTSGQGGRAGRNNNNSSTGRGNSTNNAWATGGMFSPSMDTSGRGVSRLETVVLQVPRGGVSWDDVFVSKVDAASSPIFCRTGKDFNQAGKSTNWRLGRAPESGTTGQDTIQTDTPDGNVAREPERIQDGLARTPVNSSSTLLVPGSLFVGRGLGLKKTPAWVPPVGSAKKMLKRIMDDSRDEQRDSRDEQRDEDRTVDVAEHC